MRSASHRAESRIHTIQQCRPMHNGYVESFNGKFRDVPE